MDEFVPLTKLIQPAEFLAYLQSRQIELPFDESIEVPDGPLANPIGGEGFQIGNRFSILPLEGKDSDTDGNPTDATVERWREYGRSGAKLIWGESAAVRSDGCSAPTQLQVATRTVGGLANLKAAAVEAHGDAFGTVSDFKVGLQLTHSGRLSHPGPSGEAAPITVRHHPRLDATFGPDPGHPLVTDQDLYLLVDDYVRAAANVADAGYDFVDLKACHGYLSHELLGAYERPGDFGGSLENRTRFLRLIVEGVRRTSPDLKLALRLSAFDTVTYEPDEQGIGRPVTHEAFRFWFGTDESGHEIDLSEPIELLKTLKQMGVELICVTGSSPYNSWHLQRPALTPRPNEYATPEDPLVGVARHIQVTRELKEAVPGITTVGSGYSYLQQWLPNVAQAAVRAGSTDLVGIARMHIAYPRFIADIMAGVPLDKRRVATAV